MKILRLFPSIVIISILLATTTGMRPLSPLETLGATITVNTTSDEYDTGAACSLREAITAANNDAEFGGCTGGSGSDTILLTSGTYLLTRSGSSENNNQTGDLDINSDVRLEGTGLVIIDAGGDDGIHDRVLDILESGTVTLTDLTITGGRSPDITGDNSGGGIQNSHSLTLDHVIIRDNSAGDGFPAGNGGGIFNAFGSTLNIQNSLIENNRAGNDTNSSSYYDSWAGGGGGISVWAGLSMTINNTTITNNHAGTGGSGPHSYGGGGGGIEFTLYSESDTYGIISNSTISDNTAGANTYPLLGYMGGEGGGIVAFGKHNLILINCTISGNSSGSGGLGGPGWGGGILADGPVIIRYSTIYNNRIGSSPGLNYGAGGGLFVTDRGSVTLGSSILAGNTDSQPYAYAPDCYSTIPIISEDYNLIGDTKNCPLTPTPAHSIRNPEAYSLPPLGMYGGLTQTHPLPAGNLAVDWIPIGNAGCGTTYTDDQRGYTRPVNGDGTGTSACDIGAYERQFFSFVPMINK